MHRYSVTTRCLGDAPLLGDELGASEMHRYSVTTRCLGDAPLLCQG
ncbi:hypothetical protein [Novipirellula aureliae]|nr:hypothetical protein [Novipirellula aureliae]